MKSLLTSWRALTVVTSLIVSILTPVTISSPSQALSGSDFQPGYIISDENFFASQSLNESEIRDFLQVRGSNCQSGYICLRDYTQRTTSIASDRYCSGYLGQASETAAAIISKTATSCGISPKVLLVLLQKEQGLVTRSDPAQWRYNSATGMGCPDTAGCDASVAGFFYQVFYAARSFKYYIANNSSYRYHWGQDNNIQYNPNAACGSQNVFIRNQATAALYIYTPYVPSAAALADMYGAGADPGCSAYGNRNFWRYYSDWFGSPTGNSPVVSLDAYEIEPGKIRIRGWALDVDSPESLQIHAYFNNVGIPIPANISRPDLATNLPLQYRGVGINHGFDAEINVPVSGALRICLYAINIGSGENNRFDCRSTGALSGNPVGWLDSAIPQGNSVNLSGWSLDPDSAGSVALHVYASGKFVGELTASNPRADLARLFPVQGISHGFSSSVTVPSGFQTICVYGINVGRGENSLIGCSNVNVVGGSPVGVVDDIVQNPGSFTLNGWAFEPGNSSITPIHVYVNGLGIAGATGGLRPDVQRVFSNAPSSSGYSITIPVELGQNRICVYAIDVVGGDGHKLLQCRVVDALAGSPFGALDSVTGTTTTVSAKGWAIDPDVSGSLGVHMYVDGQFAASGETNISRPDVFRIYSKYSEIRGYNLSVNNLSLSPGRHKVCLYGINAGLGDNSLIRCQDLLIP